MEHCECQTTGIAVYIYISGIDSNRKEAQSRQRPVGQISQRNGLT